MAGDFHCYDLLYSDDLRDVFALDDTQITVIEVLGPIGLAFCAANMLMILLIRSLNEPPSDILFFISLLTALKVAIYFATIIYNGLNPTGSPVPPSFNNFCQATGVVDVFSELSKFIATALFCMYYLSKIKNPLKAWISEHREIYIVSFFLVVTGTAIVYFSNNVGVSVFGYCSFKFSTASQYVQLVFSLAFIATLLACSALFLKYLRKVAKDDLTFRKYFRYYFKFLLIFSCDQLLLIASHTVIALTCAYDTGYPIFTACQVIDKVAVVATPIFIFAVLVNHPRFKKVVLVKVIRVIARKWNLVPHSSAVSNENGYADNDIILSTGRNAVLIELNNLSGIDTGYISQLKNKNRACFLATILACLVIEEQEAQEMLDRDSALPDLEFRESQLNLRPLLSYNSFYRFAVNSHIFDHYHDIFLHKLPVITISFLSHCPPVFEAFRSMDRIGSLRAGLLPERNEKEIIKDANEEGEGGRSGQFFFFNYDRSLILKTLNGKEKGLLLAKLEQFSQHFSEHPQSFIVKVYALFSARNDSTGEESHFMLMGNILRSVDRHCVLKVYDLKGSSHHREVLSKTTCRDEVVASTLKDLDFIKIERKVWISEQDSQEVKGMLLRDAEFLCRNKLIDYSLLVVKIDYRELGEGEVRYYRSTREFSTGYVFGIIDYLQTWNIKKMGEKWYKSLFAKPDTISSQNPAFYFQRFSKQVLLDFFP